MRICCKWRNAAESEQCFLVGCFNLVFELITFVGVFVTEFLHGYDKQAQAKEVTLHFQMYAREHVFSLFSTGMKATMSTVFLPSSMCRMLASEHVFSLFSDSMKDTLSTSPFPDLC